VQSLRSLRLSIFSHSLPLRVHSHPYRPLSTSSGHIHSPFDPVALVACIPNRFDNVLRSVKIIRSAIIESDLLRTTAAHCVISGELRRSHIVDMELAMRRRTCIIESSLTLENTGRDILRVVQSSILTAIGLERTLLRHTSFQ
jgi:hypothetical protein